LVIREKSQQGFTSVEMLTQQASLQELLLECGFNLGELLSGLVLLHGISAALLGDGIFFTFGKVGFSVLSATQRQQIVRLVELFEWCGIDGDDAVLHQGLGTNQLVVRCVVNNIENTGLAGRSLRGPGEVSSLQTKSTELAVSSASSHKVDALRSDLKYLQKYPFEVIILQSCLIAGAALEPPRIDGLTFVELAGRPNSYLRFLRMSAFLPPVARRL
jgi:hypothetical protein